MKGEAIRRQAMHLMVLWLLMLFCAGLYLRFQRPASDAEATAVTEVINVAERLTVVARYSERLPAELKEQMLELAATMETDPAARRVIEGEAGLPPDSPDLSPTYSLLARDLLEPETSSRAELEELAAEGEARFLLSLSLLALITLGSLLTFLAPRREKAEPKPPTDLQPVGVLTVFLLWDALGFFGIGLVAGVVGAYLDTFTLVMVSQLAVYSLLLLVLSRAKPRSDGNPFRRFSPSWIGKGYFLALLLVFGTNALVTLLWGVTPQSENPILRLFVDAPVWRVASLGALVVLIGPFFEEILFRGWLFGGLREKWGDGWALLVSSSLFAAIHGDAPGFPALFALGMVFGWVYRESGSLWASVLVHALWNATTFSLLIAMMP